MKKWRIEKSFRKNKKLQVLTPNGWLHFGDSRYSDYLQHKDKKRRYLYLKRASKIRDKNGKLTINNPLSANYWSTRILWKYKNKHSLKKY